MAPRARTLDPAQRRPTYLQAWRKHNGLSLREAVARLGEIGFPLSMPTLSRVEARTFPYSQDLLEALARIYGCEPDDLLRTDPGTAASPDPLVSIMAELKIKGREGAAARLLRALLADEDPA